MQKKKNAKRKCINVESSCEYESLNNLNNPYGYDFCYNGRSNDFDCYKKLHHIFNNEYFDKR